MGALVNRSLECAKEHKYELVTVDCTSFYTANYFQKAGWNCIYTLPYVHFKDKDGNQLFPKPNSPHLHVRCFALEILQAPKRKPRRAVR